MRESGLMVVGNGFGNTGVNRAGANGIDGNALFAQFNGQTFCETDNAVFGRRIGRIAGATAQALGRGDIDDTRRVRLS